MRLRKAISFYLHDIVLPMVTYDLKNYPIFNSTNLFKSVRWVLDAGGCGITNTFINF